MNPVLAANLAVRFLLELGALAALARWGWCAAGGGVAGLLAAVGAALVTALVWGAYVSPKARFAVPPPARLGIELAVFGSAVAALAASAPRWAAVTFGVAVAAHELARAALLSRGSRGPRRS
jgi:hypothetical protein